MSIEYENVVAPESSLYTLEVLGSSFDEFKIFHDPQWEPWRKDESLRIHIYFGVYN